MDWLKGLIDLPWWGYLIAAYILTHITLISVTVFLHRHQAHRGLDMHPIASHFFRLWLWLTTGMVTKEWVAVHRKHHARCETHDDPHSPQIHGLRKVLWQGAELYKKEAANQDTLEKFGYGTPDDWLERHVYSKHSILGIVLLFIVYFSLFGVNGIWMWALQMMTTPFSAAGVINGVGHFLGYRNFENEDASTNIVPWGILICGEELHNNHHTFGTSAKFSYKWWEFDIGWMYIRLLSLVGLVKVRKMAPKMRHTQPKELDEASLQAIIANRYALAAKYAKLAKHTISTEVARLKQDAHLPQIGLRPVRRIKIWLKQDAKDTPAADKTRLNAVLSQSPLLNTVYHMRQDLARLWERSNLTREQLLQHLQIWCQRAEQSGIAVLQEFAQRLRRVG
jgi:stearoyl-CoA desaturase (delta-9 desaturase)